MLTAEPPVSDQSKCQDFSDYLAVTALQVQQISRFDSENRENCEHLFQGIIIVFWPVTKKFRTRKQATETRGFNINWSS